MKDDSRFVEKKVASRSIYEGSVLHLFVDEIELPDGRPAVREYVDHVGAVAVLPLTEDGRVLCVRQFRYAQGRMLLEIPAGKLDFAGADPDVAARRELSEETGADCAELVPLGLFIPSPAILAERTHLYLARGLSMHNPDPDDDEFLDLVSLPFEELHAMVMRGDVPDGKTQLAVLKVAELLRREGEMT